MLVEKRSSYVPDFDTNGGKVVDEKPGVDYLMLAESIFAKCHKVLADKNHDYAGTDDFFKNFCLAEKLGVTSTEKGMMVRLLDKMQRICNGISGSEFHVKDEKIFDTIEDAVNYLVLMHMYLSTKKVKE